MRAIQKRTCPVCGYDDSGKRPILAALEDLNLTWARAVCTCPVCGARWHELDDQFNGTLVFDVERPAEKAG